MPAVDTKENRLAQSVLLIDATAFGALARRVAWIDKEDGDASPLGFVCHELSQLPERPVMQATALPPSGLDPVADAFQVFQPDGATGALRGQHNFLGNEMVDGGLESPVFSRQLFESAFGGFSPALLQTRTTAGVFNADFFDNIACVDNTITVGGYVNDAEIDAEHIGCFGLIRVRQVADAGDVPFAAHVHQIDFAFAEGEQTTLVLASNAGNLLPAGNRPDRYGIPAGHKPDDAIIVGLCGNVSEEPLCLAIQFVGISDLGDATDGSLCGQAELISDTAIGQFLQRELPEGFLKPCRLTKQQAALQRVNVSVRRTACSGVGSNLMFATSFMFPV